MRLKQSLMLIDIHTHHFPQAGNTAIYNIRVDEQDVEFVQQDNLFYAVGIHPWDTHKADENLLQKLTQLLQYKEVVAIGECGLDKFADASYEQQKELFLQHIELSESLTKPLIIHCVKYFNELIQIRKKHQPKQAWIVHGFRGKPQLVQQLIDVEFYLSFGENFNPESVKICPLNRIFIETDESTKALYAIYTHIAKHKELNVNDLAKHIQNNLRDIL